MAGIAVVLVVGLLIWGLATVVPGLIAGTGQTQWGNPGKQAICPQPGKAATATPKAKSGSQVASGHLSYPQLGAPWGAPQHEPRMPFATNAQEQTAIDQKDYGGAGVSWVSQVSIADITSGDGFASNKAAAEQILSCSLGIFYSDTVVTKKILRSTATTVDGHQAWLLEAQLSFSIPGLKATSERLQVVVVDVDPKSQVFGLFFSSVPNTEPARLVDVAKTLNNLKVVG